MGRTGQNEREQKDIFFKVHPKSPIPPEERERFQGLKYYPPQDEYRFEIALREHFVKKKVRMTYTRGEEGEFICWGEFRFKIRGKLQTLQAYKNSEKRDRFSLLSKIKPTLKKHMGQVATLTSVLIEIEQRMENGS